MFIRICRTPNLYIKSLMSPLPLAEARYRFCFFIIVMSVSVNFFLALWRVLHISLLVMNRLNKTEFAVFSSLMQSLLPRDLTYQILFIKFSGLALLCHKQDITFCGILVLALSFSSTKGGGI